MLQFFTSALDPDVKRRHHTAGEMLTGWRAIFAPVPHTQPDNAEDLAASAVPSTPLTRSGLSARALSAIEPLGVETVGELVALDPSAISSSPGELGQAVRLNRLPGAADATRREVKSRARSWRNRLGAEAIGLHGDQEIRTGTQPDPVAAARLLGSPFDAAPKSLRRQAVRKLLGLDDGVDAFIPQSELGTALGASKQRGPQLIDEMQRAWAEDPQSRDVLDALRETVFTGLDSLNGVAAVDELTDLIRSVLPGPVEATDLHVRLCAGLLRVVLDRAAALDRADALDEPLERRRRRDGRLALVATSSGLLAAAEAVGRRADELVMAAQATGEPVITANSAAEQLRAAFVNSMDANEKGDLTVDSARLIRLALLGAPVFDVDLEFSGGLSEARVVDVAADVLVDGAQRVTEFGGCGRLVSGQQWS